MASPSTMKPFSGTFLYPGVSLNGCLYTSELIGKAVARMQERIADPDGLPIPMRTHHQAGDNSALIVGRVIGVRQAPDGSAKYEARWYDTGAARDIAALVQPTDGGPPGLKSVSIHGYFLGETKIVNIDGQKAQTASDLEINAIDFTANPGVVQALIDAPGAHPPTESAPPTAGRTPIAETWEIPVATATITEEAPPTPAPAAEAHSDQQPAAAAVDSGQGDPAQPIKTKADLRRAIKATGRSSTAESRAHVIERAHALSLDALIPDTWNPDGSLKETATRPRYSEIRECYSDGPAGAGFAIDAYNGPLSITMRAPSIDPADLRAIAAAAITAACDALQALDPDWDADIDVTGAPAEDTDAPDPDLPEDPAMATTPGAGCPCGCGCSVPHDMAGGPGCPCPCGTCETCHSAPAPAAENTDPAPAAEEAAPQTPAPNPAAETTPAPKEPAVTDVTPAAETAAPVPTTAQSVQPLITLTQEQFAQLLATVTPAAPAAESAPTPPAAPAVETTPAASEPATSTTAESTTKAAIEAAMKDSIPAILAAYGIPPRKGLHATETEQPGEQKQPTPAELWANRADILLGDFGK